MTTSKKTSYGRWLNHRYLELNGRIKKSIQRPRRERLAARLALSKLNIPYKEAVPFFNPLHTGFKEKDTGTIQWLDFCIFQNKLLVILFDIQYPGHGVKPHERRSFTDKMQYLKEKSIPYLILRRTWTSQEMEIRIRLFIRKERYVDK